MEKKWDGDGVPLAESNCEGIGSDEDKALRKAAAQTETAWEGAGKEAGLWVWRVENFGVKPWPKEHYGRFYKGDSYIVLHTAEKESGGLVHQIHFWLGQETSNDERGTAAYKTVELDDLLDGLPTQHREVMMHESVQFLALFEELVYLNGGIESAFDHVSPDVYLTKLFQVKKFEKKGRSPVVVQVTEVPCERDSMHHGDCFVLDTGTKLYSWFGDEASPFEKNAANLHAENTEASRHGKAKATHTIDKEFWDSLGGEGDIKSAAEAEEASAEGGRTGCGCRSFDFCEGVLYRLSDTTGTLTCEEVARGDLNRGMLKSEDVFLLDEGAEIFIWIGKGASAIENRNAYRTAVNYLRTNNKPDYTPIHIFKEGAPIKNEQFNQVFSE